MKNILNIILFFSFTVCLANENPKLQIYRKFLLTLNQSKFYSTTIATSKYKELFFSENLNVKDSAFVIFEKFYDEVCVKLNEIHQENEFDYQILFDHDENGQKVKIPNIILNYKNDLTENGFEIAINEGTTYIRKDRNFISKNFYDYVSPTMKKYCTFKNTITKEGTEDDGVLTVSPTRIAERIIWLENFIKSNPNFQINDECKIYYKYFLYLLLNGIDHSHILEDENLINQDFVKAYDFITLENSKTKTSKLVLPFYEFLKTKQISKAYDLVEKYTTDGIIEY